jgi:preprotein translocase subunit YajC
VSFFYFPEDKTELIYPIVTLILFVVAAVLFTYFMIKKNRKDEAKFEEEYKEQIEQIEKENKKSQ